MQQLKTSIVKLMEAGLSTPVLDTEVLLAYALKISRNELLLKDSIEIPESFFELIERRCKHEPVAYIIGKKEFWDLEFFVNRNVLIPRPETETIIEQILLKHPDTNTKLRFLDLGTGSGCIILSLLNIYKNSTGVATDISDDALKVAEQNADTLGIDRVKFVKSDWFSAIGPNTFDVIISNPPYILPSEEVAKEVKDYEPHLALFNGLEPYKIIAENAKEYLAINGFIAVEIGYAQGRQVCDIFSQCGFLPRIIKDLAGKDRVVESQ